MPYVDNPAARYRSSLYGRQPTAAATNENAAMLYGDPQSVFYQNFPRRTVGWNFGNPGGFHPDNVRSNYQTIQAARGNPYRPYGAPGLQVAPTGVAGYAQQMQTQNPDGTWFGGALPAMGTSFGGAQRPMFMGAPNNQPGPSVSPQYMAQFAQGVGGYFNPQTGVMGGNNKVMDMSRLQFLRGAIGGGFGPGPSQEALAANRKTYQGNRAMEMARRQAGVSRMALARSDAMRRRTGNLSMEEQAMFGIPGYANQQLQNQNSRQNQMADQYNGYMERLASLAQAIPQMGMTPEAQQQMMSQVLGGMGMPGFPAGAFQKPLSEAPRPEDVAKVSRAEREQLVNGFAPETQRRILAEAAGIGDSPGFLEWLWSLNNLNPAPGMQNSGMRTGSRYAPGAREELSAMRKQAKPQPAAPQKQATKSPWNYIPFIY